MKCEFTLISGSYTIPLNNESGIVIADVSGLESSFEGEYESIEAGHFYRSARTDRQPTIDGTLYFTGADPYNDFKTFAAKIGYDSKMQLRCRVGGVNYLKNVELRSFSRTERGRKSLQADISWYCTSPWFFTENFPISGNTNITLPAKGDMDGAFTINLTGSITNPTITSNKGGSLAVSGSVNGLMASSVKGDMFVTDASGANLIDQTDIAANPFFKIPKTGCTISVSGGTGTLTRYTYFVAV